jgi:hypothetical protein
VLHAITSFVPLSISNMGPEIINKLFKLISGSASIFITLGEPGSCRLPIYQRRRATKKYGSALWRNDARSTHQLQRLLLV